MVIFVDEENQILGKGVEPDWNVWRSEYVEDSSDNIDDVIMHCRKHTEYELKLMRKQQAKLEAEELLPDIPDALADLSSITSENSVSISDISDAIAELSEVVSDMTLEGVSNG